MEIRELRPGFNGILGITRTAEGFQAAIDARGAERVSLLLYDQSGETLLQEIPYPEEAFVGNIASLELVGAKSFDGCYSFTLDGEPAVDPYALVVEGRGEFGTEAFAAALRCRYQKPAPAKKEESLKAASRLIIYKLHVRGFTMSETCRVRKKGTFAGLKDKLNELADLGINALQLMPAYDFDEITPLPAKGSRYAPARPVSSRINYWGYTGGRYFMPKPAYTAGTDPVKEFKALVQAVHDKDMVLFMEFYFPADTGAAFIRRVLYHWKQTYGVDGFALFGPGLPARELAADPLLARTRLIFNGIAEGEVKRTKDKHIMSQDMSFQNCMRRFLKSDEGMVPEMLYLNRRIPEAMDVVNYITSHDGFTLADLVSYNFRCNEANGEDNRDGSDLNFSWNCGEEGPSRKKAVTGLRRQQMRNLICMLLLSQGTPMLYAGDEMGNSQQGNNNAWCQDNETGWVTWSRRKADREFRDFVRAMIAFRKAHPVFAMTEQPRNTDYKSFGSPDLSYHGQRAWFVGMDNASRGAGLLYNGAYVKEEPEDYLLVIYNMYWDADDYALPSLPAGLAWCDLADTTDPAMFVSDSQTPLSDQKMVSVAARSVRILHAVKAALPRPEKLPEAVEKADNERKTEKA